MSAKQIRHGYFVLARDRSPLFTRFGYGTLMSTLFKVYSNIPFLSTMRSIFDYVLSETSMDVFMWIKLDDIYQKLFYVKCEMDYRRRFEHVLSGKEEMPRIWKIIYADLFFYVVYALLILPFVIGINYDKNGIFENNGYARIEFAVGHIQMKFSNDTYRGANIDLYNVNSKYRVVVESEDASKDNSVQYLEFPNVGDSNWNPPPPIASKIKLAMLHPNSTNISLVVDLRISVRYSNNNTRKNIFFKREIGINTEEARLNFSKAMDLYLGSATGSFAQRRYEEVEETLNLEQHEVEISGLLYNYCVEEKSLFYRDCIAGAENNLREMRIKLVHTESASFYWEFETYMLSDKNIASPHIQAEEHFAPVKREDGAYVFFSGRPLPFKTTAEGLQKILSTLPGQSSGSTMTTLIFAVFLAYNTYLTKILSQFFNSNMYEIPYSEMKYPDLLIDICKLISCSS